MESVKNIPITRPLFGPEEMRAVQQPLETGWVVQGPFVRRFEERIGAFTGARHAVATTSCTTALHIGVAALGLKPGDEVIVPAFTWIATANIAEFMGARPVFADVDLATFNVDPAAVEAAITPRTVGIVPVHLFGLCADMDPIMRLAERHKLWVLEDAACALGGRYKGRHSGTIGTLGAFSFHPRKAITTGEGGMITTARDDLATLCRSMRDHGASVTDEARHSGKAAFLLAQYKVLGYNFRMTDIQGALGCAQMDRLEGILAERTKQARWYDRRLSRLQWLRTPTVPEGYAHGYQAYVCLLAPEEPTMRNVDEQCERRNALLTRLEAQGISTRQGTHAPFIQDYYTDKYGYRPAQFPRAYMADRLTVTLPLYPGLTEADQERVAGALEQTFARG